MGRTYGGGLMTDWVYDADIDGVQVMADEWIDDQEAAAYVERYREKKRGIYALFLHIDGDYVDVEYRYKESTRPFERIRRITGYLVGTLDRWNDGKRAEENDRVKHGV